MRLARPALAALLLAALLPAGGGVAAASQARGEVTIDGVTAKVSWTDGDTFRVRSGPLKGRTARLQGVNALETYGPVHRFGTWRPEQLQAIALSSAALAASAAGRCASGGEDRYGRLLVDCPDAAAALVRAGKAMVFAVDAPPDHGLLALQGEAQRLGAGMWAGGRPARIVTSLHSRGEAGLEGRPFDRLADTRTGETSTALHDRTYRVCQEVCHGEGADRSCMIYVPYEIRYRDRPRCLRSR